MLELNDVLLDGELHTLSLMAEEGLVTCLTGGSSARRTRWLHAVLGFVPLKGGYICIDGEPLSDSSVETFRKQMAYAPSRLIAMGEVKTYDAPSVQDIFNLQANREQPISNGILAEEIRKIAPVMPTDGRAQLLAVAVLLNKHILLADNPLPSAADYLRNYAQQGHIVIVASDADEFRNIANVVIEI